MNNWQILNRICFTTCIICIAGGTALSLSMIWCTHDSELLFKMWGTMGVLFFASVATLVVSRVVGGKAGALAPSSPNRQ
jgi:hypothetical protein